MRQLIFNADVGEEAGFDAEIMPYVSWCNIACGSHAGGDEEIRKTIRLALDHGVKIGAHPSYPDRQNFGRVKMEMSNDDLIKTITDQIRLVKFYVEQMGGELHHVKPHGALYNEAVKNEEVASSILNAVKNIDKSLVVITQKKHKDSYLSGQGLKVKYEAFADRNYNEDLSLVSRSENNAVLINPHDVFNHVFKMVSEGRVKVKSGAELPIFFDTICVHGDNPKSVAILKHLHAKFKTLSLL
ncbi:5-oxoprolinase subunit PxpA [Aquimarina sediminis]|uniref:5-oxoprolinase subunit PxpA n=1 Tax=Aquimarina sediminis TaxID=2070536 RepID=UPI000CA00D71|nr:5-oxoprolinase subunit PxpA [Aquimarina sediminis]